ncbi:unnamed protein product [Arctia plantaginis]|uniref:Uncharacterized protein n=1 Tax=Arctia plantaginis TaxID=874455 RepID=A0A8S1BMA7_ARCPL|nr:unnamed protein product [Arctia plantaginis]
MYKLVVLFSLAVMVTAKPSIVAPFAYISVTPGFSSLSQYSSSVVHGSPPVHGGLTVYSRHAHNSIAAMFPQQSMVPEGLNELNESEEHTAHSVHHATNRFLPYHQLRKRSIGVPTVVFSTVVSPVSYTNPLTSAYFERANSHQTTRPVVSASAFATASPLGLTSAYARILGSHPN